MLIKLSEALDSIEALKSLSQNLYSGKVAWDISKLIRLLEAELKDFYELRDNIIRRLGEVDINDPEKAITVKPDNRVKFMDEIKEIIDQTIDLKIHPFKIKDITSVAVKPSDLVILHWMMEDENTETIVDEDEEVSKRKRA